MNFKKWSGWLALSLLALAPASYSSLRDRSGDSQAMHPTKHSATAAEPAAADQDAPATDEAAPADDKLDEPAATPTTQETPAPKTTSKHAPRIDRADAFVAGPDWEFDGFVSGGQDSNVRSMFYLNDLIYLNIGSQQGVATGAKIGIYKRGDKVRDPQTGKFIGYEVRRAAIAKATDRVDEETSAVRILSTYEAVEIGDLVRLEK